jgi:hypothetical protein
LSEFKERYFDPGVDSEYLEEQNNLLVYTSSAVDTTQFIIQAAEVSEGIVFPRMFDPKNEEVEIVKDFVQAYKEQYQQNPDLYAAYGYDTALLIGYTLMRKDIEKAVQEPFNFRMHMNDVGFQGVTGSVDFQQSTGEVAKTPALYKMLEFGESMLVKDYEQERIIEARDRLRQQMNQRRNR